MYAFIYDVNVRILCKKKQFTIFFTVKHWKNRHFTIKTLLKLNARPFRGEHLTAILYLLTLFVFIVGRIHI